MARIKESTGGIAYREAFEGAEADRSLHCDLCDREIVRLAVRDDCLVVASPLRRIGMDGEELRGRDPAALLRAKPPALHQALMDASRDGLDFYCPDCDQMICEDHYHLRPVWDDGFYDYTLGTCPAGHQRIVDD